jgi:hypothetical protein
MEILKTIRGDWKFFLSVWIVLFIFPGSIFGIMAWETGLPANFWQASIEQVYSQSNYSSYRCRQIVVLDLDYVSSGNANAKQTLVTSDKGLFTTNGYWVLSDGTYIVSDYNDIVAKVKLCPAPEDLRRKPAPFLMVIAYVMALPTFFCLFVAFFTSSSSD